MLEYLLKKLSKTVDDFLLFFTEFYVLSVDNESQPQNLSFLLVSGFLLDN